MRVRVPLPAPNPAPAGFFYCPKSSDLWNIQRALSEKAANCFRHTSFMCIFAVPRIQILSAQTSGPSVKTIVGVD